MARQKFVLDQELPDFGLVRRPVPQTAAVPRADADTLLEDAAADYLKAKAAMADAKRRIAEAVMEPGYVYGAVTRVNRKRQHVLIDWTEGKTPRIKTVSEAAYHEALGDAA